jgi:hypothetical protein
MGWTKLKALPWVIFIVLCVAVLITAVNVSYTFESLRTADNVTPDAAVQRAPENVKPEPLAGRDLLQNAKYNEY